MNFNQMDLIKIKEMLYDPIKDPHAWEKVSNFISKLIDFGKEFVGEHEDREDFGYWDRFFARQEMIEHAYQINKLKVLK